MFLQNEWYAASWGSALGREPVGRLICGEPVVLYRDEAGQAVALENTCPHRLLPLSMGFVEGDAIRCKYHGLLLGRDGVCREMPGGGEPNPSVRVKTYPVVERYHLVWVWIGDPEAADPAKLPDLWMTEAEGWQVAGGAMELACDYRLVIDNLMDLTHETYVHATSVGQKELHDFPIETRVFDRRVVTSRWMPGIEPPPSYKMLLEGYDGPVDRWQICEFSVPANVIIDVGVAKTSAGATLDAHDEVDIRNFVLDFVTPATERTCTYFWGSARGPGVYSDDPETFERVTRRQEAVFLEDAEVLEAQQRHIDLLPHRKLQAYAVDAGGVRVRLMIDKLRKAQAAA